MWPFHRHRWQVIRADPIELYNGGRFPCGRKTDLYLTCSCGKTKFKTKKGWWEVKDFTPPTAPDYVPRDWTRA